MRVFLSMVANRAVDDYAINTMGIPGTTLMKNAGNAAIYQMEAHGLLQESPKVLILAGKGNNGGDGYVIAAGLVQRGISVTLITIVDESGLHGDALHYYRALKDLDLEIDVWRNTIDQQTKIKDADVIVDALLGTGISGEIRSPYSEIITQSNLSKARIVAVDVPSGMSGDLGRILEPCIKAELTISMGFGKQGSLFEPARSHCGKTVPVDIGFPADSLEHVDERGLHELEQTDFPASRFTRSADAHKYSSGKVYIIAGSRGFTGAALLASTAALRSGAGLVKLALPESLGHIGESTSLETIVEYMPETSEQSFAAAAFPALKTGCSWADVVALGPGIGRNPETQQVVRDIIANVEHPLLIDADALFALSKDPQILLKRNAPTILTPHLGEFKRLLDLDGDQIPSWQDALTFAQTYGVFVLLKGAPSILASPSGDVSVNSTGYSGMATAGSGDVLSGIIVSLWAQWINVPQVLNFAMYVHGKAADLNREAKGVLGLTAGDIVNSLPETLKEYGGLPT